MCISNIILCSLLCFVAQNNIHSLPYFTSFFLPSVLFSVPFLSFLDSIEHNIFFLYFYFYFSLQIEISDVLEEHSKEATADDEHAEYSQDESIQPEHFLPRLFLEDICLVEVLDALLHVL